MIAAATCLVPASNFWSDSSCSWFLFSNAPHSWLYIAFVLPGQVKHINFGCVWPAAYFVLHCALPSVLSLLILVCSCIYKDNLFKQFSLGFLGFWRTFAFCFKDYTRYNMSCSEQVLYPSHLFTFQLLQWVWWIFFLRSWLLYGSFSSQTGPDLHFLGLIKYIIIQSGIMHKGRGCSAWGWGLLLKFSVVLVLTLEHFSKIKDFFKKSHRLINVNMKKMYKQNFPQFSDIKCP